MKKLITLLALVIVFASCSKEENVIDPYWFNIEVVQGEVSLTYDKDGEVFTQYVEAGYKPVFNPDKYPNAIKVNCIDECVYVVNGDTFKINHNFVKP